MNGTLFNSLAPKLRFLLAVAALAGPMGLLGRALLAQCPHTIVHEQFCPYPSTTVDCGDIIDEITCEGQWGQKQEPNEWGCSASGSLKKQCLDSLEKEVCYVECDCIWGLDPEECLFQTITCVPHKRPLKETSNCPP